MNRRMGEMNERNRCMINIMPSENKIYLRTAESPETSSSMKRIISEIFNPQIFSFFTHSPVFFHASSPPGICLFYVLSVSRQYPDICRFLKYHIFIGVFYNKIFILFLLTLIRRKRNDLQNYSGKPDSLKRQYEKGGKSCQAFLLMITKYLCRKLQNISNILKTSKNRSGRSKTHIRRSSDPERRPE